MDDISGREGHSLCGLASRIPVCALEPAGQRLLADSPLAADSVAWQLSAADGQNYGVDVYPEHRGGFGRSKNR